MTVRHPWIAAVATATAALLLSTTAAHAAAPTAVTSPVAHPDSLVVPGQAGSAVVDVLANDTYDAPAVVAVAPTAELTAPAHGTVALTTVTVDGVARTAVSYRAEPGFAGKDSFGYSVTDASGGTAESTVAVTVTAPADRPVTFAAPSRIVVLRSATLTGAAAPAGGVLPAVTLQVAVGHGLVGVPHARPRPRTVRGASRGPRSRRRRSPGARSRPGRTAPGRCRRRS